MKLAKKRCRFYEVPISYHGRTYEEGKKITWKDGVAALYYMIRFQLLGLTVAVNRSAHANACGAAAIARSDSVTASLHRPTTHPCNPQRFFERKLRRIAKLGFGDADIHRDTAALVGGACCR